MKKRISLLAGFVFLLIFSFTGCGKREDTVQYDQKAMESYANALIQNFNSMSDKDVKMFKDMSELQLGTLLLQSRLPVASDDFISMLDAWKTGVEECGVFEKVEGFKVEASNGGPVLTADAKFKDRQAELLFNFDEKMNLESLTVNAYYSTGEVLEKAGLNTILGMGTVFIVLIFISFIISLFRFIPAIEKKFNKSAEVEAKAPIQLPSEKAPLEAVSREQNDEELAAVIAASIAALEGTSADGFIVRSIKRRKTNNGFNRRR